MPGRWTVIAEGDRITEVDLSVTNESLIGPARVDRGDRPQRLDNGLRYEGGRGQVEALTLLELVLYPIAVPHELGHVDLHDGMRVRGAPSLHHVVRDRAPHLRERHGSPSDDGTAPGARAGTGLRCAGRRGPRLLLRDCFGEMKSETSCARLAPET